MDIPCLATKKVQENEKERDNETNSINNGIWQEFQLLYPNNQCSFNNMEENEKKRKENEIK